MSKMIVAQILAASAFVAAVSTATAAPNGDLGQRLQVDINESQSGQATGKRQHKPIRMRMYYDQRPGETFRSR